MVAILFALMLLVLAIHFAVYLRYAFSEVFYPFEIFDAEDIIWQQAMLIPGPRMYGDIDRYPFLVFHYPPLYHSIVRGLAALGVDPLIAGRGLSVCASLAAGVAIGAIVFRFGWDTMGRPRIYGALTAGLVFFCFYPVAAVSPLMRVDMLALALSVIGMRCALESTDAERSLRVAMIFFVLAAFTKQTSILAPLSVMIVVASVDPRRALRLLGFGLVLGGVPLACLVWATGGGVLRHLVFAEILGHPMRIYRQISSIPGEAHTPSAPEVFETGAFNMLTAEMEAFANAIATTTPFPTPLSEIRHGVAVFEAILRSAASGQAENVA